MESTRSGPNNKKSQEDNCRRAAIPCVAQPIESQRLERLKRCFGEEQDVVCSMQNSLVQRTFFGRAGIVRPVFASIRRQTPDGPGPWGQKITAPPTPHFGAGGIWWHGQTSETGYGAALKSFDPLFHRGVIGRDRSQREKVDRQLTVFAREAALKGKVVPRCGSVATIVCWRR